MKVDILKYIRKELESRKGRSSWDKGVIVYALELLEGLQEAIDNDYFNPSDLESPKLIRRALLNGAYDWSTYSWSGGSLIYDQDIASRLCTPYELKRTKNGCLRPNRKEEWLDVQARALHQASNLLLTMISNRTTDG